MGTLDKIGVIEANAGARVNRWSELVLRVRYGCARLVGRGVRFYLCCAQGCGILGGNHGRKDVCAGVSLRIRCGYTRLIYRGARFYIH